MTNDSRNMAARCAMLLAERIEQIRDELRADPAYERCAGDPMIVGLLLVLCNSVMHEDNWSQRGLLFEAFAGCKWPAGVTVRKRLDEVLDGLNLRDDRWRFN
jgi:hypothetical protein